MNETQLGLFAAVAAGGALGSLTRYVVAGLLPNSSFPWGTFAVNFTGCLAAGLMLSTVLREVQSPSASQAFILTGFLGGYTTLSTFTTDTLRLWAQGQIGLGLVDLALNAGVCLGGTALGLAIGIAALAS